MPARLPFLLLIFSVPLHHTFSSHDCHDYQIIDHMSWGSQPIELDETGVIEVLLQSKTNVKANIRVDSHHYDETSRTKSVKDRNQQNVTLLPNEPTVVTFPYFNSVYAQHMGNTYGIRIETMKFKNGTEYWHEGLIIATQQPRIIRELPFPFTGFSIRLKCFPGWKTEHCSKYCDAEIADQHGMRCDAEGHLRCKKGYCGIDCKKSGTKCPAYKYCICENGGECFMKRAMGMEHVYCECPRHLNGRKCNETRNETVGINAFNKVEILNELKNRIANKTTDDYSPFPRINANLSVDDREIWNMTTWASNQFLNFTNIDSVFDALQASGQTNHTILTCLLFVFVFYLYRC